MEAVLPRAKNFDCSRFSTREPDAGEALDGDGDAEPVDEQCGDLSEGAECEALTTGSPDKVYVLTRDKRSVRCTMRRPDRNFAACDCDAALQQQICHHQVAYLLQQSCDAAAVERLIYKQLGVRFGFLEGCTEEDLSELTEALREQALPRSKSPSAPAEGQGAPAAVATAIAGAASPEACEGTQTAPCVAPPSGMGAEARSRFRDSTLQKLADALQRFEGCGLQGGVTVSLFAIEPGYAGAVDAAAA